MGDEGDTARAEAELQKIRLEIEKLTLDVANAARAARMDLVLRLIPTVTVLVTVLGFVFTVWQYRAEQDKNRKASELQSIKEASERAERARKDTETAQREFMKPFLEKQQELYFEAAATAAAIAYSNDVGDRRKAVAKFWVLYGGPLVMVESQEVSGAMKKFGNCLSGVGKCTANHMKDLSLSLASALETSLLNTWNAKPEEFTKGQFIYR